MPVNAIEVKKLTVRYQSAEALSDVTLTIACGDYVGIVGPNGSGKTTFVRSLLGLLAEQSEGEALVFGKKIRDFRAWARLGYLPQKAMLLDPRFPATAREIVASGLLVRKPFPSYLTKKDTRKIDETLALLKISGFADQPIGRLSGGQQQRVLLARTLVHHPDLVILDEPTAALDPESREIFYAVLKHLHKDHGATVLLVSHDISTVGQYATKLLYLDRKVIFYGKFDEFCRSSVMTDYFGQTTQHVICSRH